MGVCPAGAHVRTTLGIRRKPDSSAKTMWAPSRAAFFLSAASLFVSSARWLFHPVPARAVLASEDSIASGAATGRHGRDDTEPGTPAGSVPQCGPSSTGWSGRSEERRVGKECRSRGSPYHAKKNDLHFAGHRQAIGLRIERAQAVG